MILGLPIDDTLVCGPVSPGGWRDSVEAAIGLRSPDVPTDQKDKNSSGIHSGWLTAHFDTCPEGAEDGVIQRYAQSCLLTYFLVLGIRTMSDRFLIFSLSLCFGTLGHGYGIRLLGSSSRTGAEHHILVRAPDSSLEVGRHSHIQLGVRCHTPFRDSGNKTSIRVPRMFHSHV
jgi:hypothetical protein